MRSVSRLSWAAALLFAACQGPAGPAGPPGPGGLAIATFSMTLQPKAPTNPAEIVNANGLVLRADCAEGPAARLVADMPAGAEISVAWNNQDGQAQLQWVSTAAPGDPEQKGREILNQSSPNGASGQGTLIYSYGGRALTVTLAYRTNQTGCVFYGNIFRSGT